ncbi:MAG: carbohydrate ABC transporter permease [Rhizobiales bacterium]|nr:carbohydrate ABC transporter permease [Hyphomicrobiales bacterium]
MSYARHRLGSPLARAAVVLGLAVFVFWSAAPIVWLVLSSVLEQKALIAQPPDLSLSNFTLQNYVTVLGSAAALGRGIMNSAIVAFFSTSVALVLGAPAAYALARLPIRRANAMAFLILATQMLPGIAIAIPLFIVISQIGLIDNVLSLGAVYLSFNRAAAVDGAGVIQTFRHIILPISIPPLTAAAVFAFIEAWNEFSFALILTRQSAQTVPLVIAQFAGQYQTVFGQMMAAALISVAPVILIAILFRDQILRGFADGMMKG